jgi:RNA polymerase sigma-70 factor (sigma-E family)
MAADDAGFRDYIGSRIDPLRRTAFALCGDWHTADDLVSTTIVKTYRAWRRISAMSNVDAYVRRVLVTAWLDEKRRPWRRERPSAVLPDTSRPAEDRAIVDRLAILEHLTALPARRRAVIVLRYYDDLSVEETAAVLGCSAGTVKSQTARALETLRHALVGVTESGSEGDAHGTD